MIEFQRARDSVEQLRALRVPLTYHDYDMGHEITPRSLTDLSAWLEENNEDGWLDDNRPLTISLLFFYAFSHRE